ncbi:MAG: hypothetical protein ACR2QK_25000 [Acidimicrobiales bacterium]
MTSPDTLADLRLADRSLRRYATHLTGDRADDVLHNAYVSAIRDRWSIVEGSRASIQLFRRVQTNAAVVPMTIDDDGSGELEAVLPAVPIENRSALLLTSLEGLSASEAAQVLGMAEAEVIDLSGSAAEMIRLRVPYLNDADTEAISRALGQIPVNQATPAFWAHIDDDLANYEPPPPTADDRSVLDTTLMGTSLTTAPAPPPEESIWPAIWAGVGALAVITLIIIFLVSRGGDDEIAADGSSTVVTTQTVPPTGQTTATVPPTAAPTPAPTAAPTVPPTVAPTAAPTAPPPTPTTPSTGNVVDRGSLPVSNGLAIVEGVVAAGSADIWRVDIANDSTLSIAVVGMNGVVVSLLRTDGTPVGPAYSDTGLLVYTEPGSFFVQFENAGGTGSYSTGIGLTGLGSGFLTNVDGQGVAVSALRQATCQTTDDGLEATLVSPGGVQVIVSVAGSFEKGGDSGTVSWQADPPVTGEVLSASPVATGLVFTGVIVAGPQDLLDNQFWLGLYGCA